MSAARPVLFVDVVTLLPSHHPGDRPPLSALAPRSLPALAALAALGWEVVLVAPDTGDGAPSPELDELTTLLVGQGVPVHGTRVSHPGELVREPGIDWSRSARVRAQATDGARGQDGADALPVLVVDEESGWPAVAAALSSPRRRTAEVHRRTRETDVRVSLDLDRHDPSVLATGVGFFDHMLDQLAKHGGFWVQITCTGDLHIDEHHTVEDVGLALGEALVQALGDKRGIGRYGFTLPMDEALAEAEVEVAALDVSGRPYLSFTSTLHREKVGDLPTEMVEHFWRSFCQSAGLNLHLRVTGENDHHVIESGFKAVARALRPALRVVDDELPTTKGML